METTIIIGFRIYWGHIGIMGSRMETTIIMGAMQGL